MSLHTIPMVAKFHHTNEHLYCNDCGNPLHGSVVSSILDEVVKSIEEVRNMMGDVTDMQAHVRGVENQRGDSKDKESNQYKSRYNDITPVYQKAINEVRDKLTEYPLTGGIDFRPNGVHAMDSIYQNNMNKPAFNSKEVNRFIRENDIKGAIKDSPHGLSKNSKMPGGSEDMPTATCKLGSILRNKDGSTCKHCYVDKPGAFMKRNDPQKHYWRNFLGLSNPHLYGAALSYQIAQHPDSRFRFQSSGDSQSPHHFALKMDVARANPDKQFWIATREAKMLKDYIEAHSFEMRDFAIPSNVTVRVSTQDEGVHPEEEHMVRSVTKMHPNITATSVNAAHKDQYGSKAYTCPSAGKTGDENSCEFHNCNACWDSSIPWIDYSGHGDKDIHPDYSEEDMEKVIQAMGESQRIRDMKTEQPVSRVIPDYFNLNQ